MAGAVGALVLTTPLVMLLGPGFFRERRWRTVHLAVLGLLISVVGQLSDMMLSSIKRDLEIKDMGATIPGHGGLLDRFDSVILVAPVAFHYINLLVGIGAEPEPARIFTVC